VLTVYNVSKRRAPTKCTQKSPDLQKGADNVVILMENCRQMEAMIQVTKL